jgi:hypothetical protein
MLDTRYQQKQLHDRGGQLRKNKTAQKVVTGSKINIVGKWAWWLN